MTDLTLYALESELEALLDSVETCPDELREELEQRITEYVGAEAAKVDNVGHILSQLESVQAHAKTETERLRIRQQAAEKAERHLEAYILHILSRRGGKPLKGHNITLSARRTEVLVIDDPDAVPPTWKRTTVQVDIPKEPIKRAIKEGSSIPGVHIEPREHLVKR